MIAYRSNPQGIAAAIGSVAAELEQALPLIAADPTSVAKVTAGIAGLKASAGALAGAPHDKAARDTLLQAIADDSNAVFYVLAQLSLPPEAALIVRIAQIVLPALEAAARAIFAVIDQPQVASAAGAATGTATAAATSAKAPS